MMKERGILFSAPMVRAILEGRKTQTRRVVKDPKKHLVWWDETPEHLRENGTPKQIWSAVMASRCPYGVPGDRLYVREEWAVNPDWNDYAPREIPEDGTRGLAVPLPVYREGYPSWDPWPRTRWRRSMHMPRWASRIDLEITDVRVERVQDITEEDARAEGVEPDAIQHPMKPLGVVMCQSHVHAFSRLWEEINAKRGYGWDANPWVWALTFRRIDP